MFEGLISAVPTPFKTDFSVDTSSVRAIYNHVCLSGIKGVLINGTIGEGLSMSLEERIQVADEWFSLNERKDLFMAVNVSCESITDAKALAKNAMIRGFDGVFCHSPSFFKPSNAGSLLDFCRLVAEECYPVPFYFYHLPDFTGARFRMEHFIPLALKAIPNFKGIKFTDFDLADLSICKKSFKDLNIFLGRDEVFFEARGMGVRAGIGSTYSIWPEKYGELIELIDNNETELAVKLAHHINAGISVLSKHGGVRAVKAALELIGLDCGPVRPPLTRVSGQELKELKDDLRDFML